MSALDDRCPGGTPTSGRGAPRYQKLKTDGIAADDTGVAPPALSRTDVLQKTLKADAATLDGRDRSVESAASVLFVLVAIAMAIVLPANQPFDPLLLAAGAAAIAVTARVRLDFVGGFTAPIVLAVVPVLFIIPAGLVPLTVAAGLVLARLVDVARHDTHLDRLLAVPGNAWFAVGPALVFGLADVTAAVGVSPGILLLALAAQLVTDFIPSAIRERFEDGTGLRAQLDGARWVYSIDLALAPLGLLFALVMEWGETAWGATLLPLVWIFSVLKRERRERLEQMSELNRAYFGTALVLGEVVEADDTYTGAHCKDVLAMSMAVGRSLGLNSAQLRNLEFAALLHDVGKVAIPKEIINKPGKLDEDEWALIKTHTIEGQQMLDQIGGSMVGVGQVVRSHHERWDGAGYPDGLVAEAIPIEAQIIAACDTYSAMTTTRTYRAALPEWEAVAELRACAGSQFDPRVVEALVAVLPTIASGEARNLEIAPVVADSRPEPVAV